MPDAEEDKPEPDLDELLELFREPDEEPRRKAVPGSVWLMLALVLSLGGVWLAARVSAGPASKDTKAGPMKPGKVADRPVRREGEETVDALEDYIARCKKGMTAREVRWIVEDFQKAGLDGADSRASQIRSLLDHAYAAREADQVLPALSPDSKAQLEKLLREMGQLQRNWYAEALIDGLHLDRPQKAILVERLSQLMERDFSKAATSWDDYEKEAGVPRALPYYNFSIPFVTDGVDPSTWLSQGEYAPWSLCELTEDQKAVTRLAEVEDEKSEEETEPNHDSESAASWLKPGEPFSSEVASKAKIDAPDRDFGVLAAAGAVFPIMDVQIVDGRGDLKIADPTRLHPAQLKVLLLLQPELAGGIKAALEEAGQ